MRTTKTMYMHTLDGQPASFQKYMGSCSLYFVGGRNRVQLVPSLKQLRKEQRQAIRDAIGDWSEPQRYGYVLVEVPNE